MKVEQFVMAYEVEQDKLRAILPDNFQSLRPVLRINAEIRANHTIYIEFNTAVEAYGKRGWLNIGHWDSTTSNLSYQRNGNTVTFTAPFLTITFTTVGIEGSCPAEKYNEGCFFIDKDIKLRPPEQIFVMKEFCNCKFTWNFSNTDANGVSIGKTLPAFATEPKKQYQKQAFSVQNATSIPCEQILGCYVVVFER